MALFGAPITLEDTPQRAIRSAFAIHREMTNFSDKIKQGKEDIQSIKMRIGVHTGPVVVGTLGNDLRVEFKAVGDTVNLASRMEGIADPGTTYVTENTFKLTEGLFQFEALGARKVKGKKEGVPVYKLLSAKEELYRPRLGLERMIYSEMVGREKELDRLELQVMKARNGEGSVVNVIGEAGIGKSRLVTELKTREVMKRVTFLEGKAISIGRNLRFYPIIDLLKQWAQIRDDDEKRTVFDKLEAAVRSVNPKEVGELLPFIATLMGIKISGRYAERVKGIEGEALEKLILKNLRDLLIKATELNPLVIVIEDLHWADASSIELMESLFRLAKTQRILFVNAFRPGFKETGDHIAKIVKENFPLNYVELVLEPLNERMSEELINNMLKIRGLQHNVIDQIVKRADGNPFFIEEVVCSFIDEGVVVIKDGSFEVTEKIDSIVIPNTVNDVLMARIDRLEEKTRDLLKIASVIGRNFFYRILIEAAKRIEDIDSRLSYLKEVQLIRELSRMKELEYLFKHALAQEATYESILSQKRKDLHLRTAASIEKVFKERLHEFYGMLAFHYGKAEHEEKTAEYLVKAGEEALKSSASNEALAYYQEALHLYTNKYGDAVDPAFVAMLEKNIAAALYNKGQYLEAIKYFDKVLTYNGEKVPKQSILVLSKFLFCFVYFLISLYLPFLRFKKTPTQKDNEIIDLTSKKIEALLVIDVKRMFIEYFYFFKKLAEFDLTKVKSGVSFFAVASTVFARSGMSFKLSRKTLDFCRNKVDRDDARSILIYELIALMHNYFAGDWGAVNEYKDSLVKKNLSTGE
jgi:tetratricopeptide (TPR) repeat protein